MRLKEYDYSQVGSYFVTICTKNHEPILGAITNGDMVLNTFGKIVKHNWDDLPNRYSTIELDSLIIMPNHIHSIISIVGAIHELPLPITRQHRRQMLLPRIIGYTKMNTAKKINQLRNTPGIPVWQRNYYEHIIRNETELNAIREYISNNSLKWEEDGNYPQNFNN